MKLKQAIGVLETHNRWRRGEDIEPMLKPTDIGIAIDTVVEYVKNNSVLDDVSQQRELLLDFLDKIGRHDYETKPFKQIVDEYLKSNNCG